MVGMEGQYRWGLEFNRDRSSIWEDGKVLEMDGVDGWVHNSVNGFNAAELHTLKMFKMVHFVLCVPYHNKK